MTISSVWSVLDDVRLSESYYCWESSRIKTTSMTVFENGLVRWVFPVRIYWPGGSPTENTGSVGFFLLTGCRSTKLQRKRCESALSCLGSLQRWLKSRKSRFSQWL